MTSINNEKQAMNSKLVTIEEAAERLGVKESYIKRMCREQKIRAFKVGKFWRMTEPSFSEFVNNLDVNGEKTKLRQDVQDKLRFHSMIRSLEAAPESIERLNGNIDQVKENFMKENTMKKIALAAKLKDLVVKRENKRKTVKMLPDDLDELAEVAYPGMKECVNEDANTLEWFFVSEIGDKKEPEAAAAEEEEEEEEEEMSPVVEMKTAGSSR